MASCNACFRPPNHHRPRTGAIQRAPSLLRRTFSSTPSARITLEEDDDHASRPLLDKNGSLHPKRPGELPISNVDLRKLISSRAPKRKPFKRSQPEQPRKGVKDPPPPNTLELRQQSFDRKYTSLEERISHSAKRNRDIQRLFEDRDAAIVAALKTMVSQRVAALEKKVSQSSAASRSLEHQYCSIKFRETPELRDRILRIEKRNANLIHDFFSLMIDCSQAFTLDLSQKLEVEYLAPRRSARDKIDMFIGDFKEINRKYDELRAKEKAVKEGLKELRLAYGQLPSEFVRGHRGLRRMWVALEQDAALFDTMTHLHRNSWLKRQFSLHPVLKSVEPRVTTDFRLASLRIASPQIVAAMALDDEAHRPYRRILQKREGLRVSAAKAMYMKRWNGPKRVDDPTLDTRWRQLDLMAPFEIVSVGKWLLVNEAWLLVAALQGKFGRMWDPLYPIEKQRHWEKIHDWVLKFREDQRLFIFDCQMYHYITWYRLQVERKLHDLGEPNYIQAAGLFVPLNPLSQDHARFEHWVSKLCSIMSDAWYTGMVWTLTQTPAMQKKWLSIINRYDELQRSRRNPVIQDLGSVGAKRKRGRRTPPMPALKSSTRRVAGRPKFGMTEYLARKSKLASSVLPAQKPTADSPKSLGEGLSSHKTPSAASSGPEDVKLRMKTAMSMLMRSTRFRDSRKSLDQESNTNDSFDPDSLKTMNKDHREGDQPAPEGRQKTAAPAVSTDSRAGAQKSLDTNPSRSRRRYGKPSNRTYCTDSRVSRDVARECDRQFPPEQTPASCVPVIAEDAEVSQSVKKVVRSDQTVSSIVESHTKKVGAPSFWSHSLYRREDGQKIVVHYCRSLASAEETARLFLDSRVIGFDMEWKAQASASDSIQNNLSLIQIANEERIALFQIALFKPARNLQDLVVPSIQRILETPDITKVGVAIKADATRLRKYLGIEAQSIFELSHLYKLVKHGLTNPKLVNKRAVNLSEQIEEHFGLPLEKNDDVRCGDWTRPLNYRQIQYAATDPYACLCLFNVMEQKRQAMYPLPPRPAHADLNMPIVLPLGETVNNEEKDPLASDPADVDIAARS